MFAVSQQACWGLSIGICRMLKTWQGVFPPAAKLLPAALVVLVLAFHAVRNSYCLVVAVSRPPS